MELKMYYVCIENDHVTSILGYEPEVPTSVQVVTITDDEYQQITNQTHVYNVTLKSVEPVDSSILARKEQEKANAIEREFLNSTDWQILRHIRQKSLGTPTTLTEAEYLALEQKRADAANRIV
jgi:hypothetical protein